MQAFVCGCCVAACIFVIVTFWILGGQIQELRRYVSHLIRQHHDLAKMVEMTVIQQAEPYLDYVDNEVLESDANIDIGTIWVCEAVFDNGKLSNELFESRDAAQ